MVSKPKTSKPKTNRAKSRKSTAKPKATAKRTTSCRSNPAASKPSKPRQEPGAFGTRTAPKGDRFYDPEMAIRKYALGLPEATEDFPWGHRAFRVGKKVFLFLAWDDG